MPDLGRYGVFVWPAYGLSALVLGWAAVQSLLAARRWRRAAERERLAARPRRRTRIVTRWVAWLPLGVLAGLAVLFVGFGLRHDPHVNPAALVGKRLPAVRLPTLDGAPAQPLSAVLADQAAAGAPVLLNVFASWCAPCAEEAPAMAELRRRGVRLVGVAYKDEPGDEHPSADTRAFLEKYGDPFTRVLVDRDGRAGIELGVSGVPETFLVGADGRVLAKHSGPLTAPDAGGFLRRVMAAEPGR